MKPLWVGNRKELPFYAAMIANRQGGVMPNGVMGILDGRAIEAMDGAAGWTYFDHSYFNRGWDKGAFRACRDSLHLTRIYDRPADRFERTGYKIDPWRKSGSIVVVIPPTEAQMAVYRNRDWLKKTLSKLSEVTDREVRVKYDKSIGLRAYTADAWAVVTHASVAGVESALAGIPVFSTEQCPAWPVNAGRLEEIETPDYAQNRLEWASSLAYASWKWEEMKQIKWDDYRYEVIPCLE